MALKETKRKAFNFLRSYYDVYNQLENDSDKLSFLDSILNKQFLNEDPVNLEFIPKLCYESQRHAIESSVKGWLRVSNNNPLTNPPTDPPTTPLPRHAPLPTHLPQARDAGNQAVPDDTDEVPSPPGLG